VADGLAFPNGMAVMPDNRDADRRGIFAKTLTAFDIGHDGSLSSRRVWAELDGHPDGICIDAEGAVWSSAGPRCLRVRERGEVLEAIELDRMCFACMLGGADGRTLFMVAAEWTGSTDLAGTEPTGKLFTARAPAPRAGRP
jgi:sugar lactone lactonase YvrE